MTWYHISYEEDSNPYICKNEKELNKLKRKYGERLVEVKDHFYVVKKEEN